MAQASYYAPVVTSYAFPATFQEPSTQGPVRRIKMRWLDVDALPSIIYRVWVVTDLPDPTGVYYTGTKSGSTAISGATVEEDYVS